MTARQRVRTRSNLGKEFCRRQNDFDCKSARVEVGGEKSVHFARSWFRSENLLRQYEHWIGASLSMGWASSSGWEARGVRPVTMLGARTASWR
jgi:hypothetical protein